MDLIIIEWVYVLILILTLFGFVDRIFFIFALMINWATALVALNDGTIVLDKVYSVASSSWILYTTSTLSSSNIPSEPMLILLALAALDALLLTGRSLAR